MNVGQDILMSDTDRKEPELFSLPENELHIQWIELTIHIFAGIALEIGKWMGTWRGVNCLRFISLLEWISTVTGCSIRTKMMIFIQLNNFFPFQEGRLHFFLGTKFYGLLMARG